MRPFNYQYVWINNSETYTIADPTRSKFNNYMGGVYQEATSVVSAANPAAYELNGFQPDSVSQISGRPVPQEPVYLLMNLGMSKNFGRVDSDNLEFPSTMRVDWIRVYQDPDATNIGCDPPDFPTRTYIEAYKEAYSNANLTTWVDDYGQTIPKNKLLGQC
ncbi:beta-glucan synthesis-associated protein-domain-containing protein [Daedaleopsis nitida]|nr:beta-glucan synthesis-associated protein-domain-containing protein [Daedaleopsis nitida]